MRGQNSSMDGFTDIRTTGWVRHLPPPAIPYAILARFDRPIGAWLLFLPGLWSIILAARGALSAVWLVLLFLAGAFIMRGAGCVVNDLWDRKLDRLVTRTATRPLAAGILRPIDALVFLAVLCVLGLLILLQLNPAAKILGVSSLALVALYPLAKRVTWWPQIMLGVTFGWGAPMGFAAAAGHLAWPALPLYLATMFWILGYDTIYAHQDREDDAMIGIKSTARLIGANTGPFLILCYSATILLLAAAMAMAQLSRFGIAALVLPACLLAAQIVRLDIDHPALCLKLFKANREAGFAVALAILIGQMT